MKRSIPVILGLSLVLSAMLARAIQAGSVELTSLSMSASPGGSPVREFPAGTRLVYAVFRYWDMNGETVWLRVTDPVGGEILNVTMPLQGSGIYSVPVTYPGQPFPPGSYTTTLRFGAQDWAVVWRVQAEILPTPTPVPLPSLRIQPLAVELMALQGISRPRPRSLLVDNQGTGLLIWQATVDASWLRLIPASGGAPSLLRVAADAEGLPGARYQSRIIINGLAGTLNSPQVVDVALNMVAPPNTATAEIRPITTTLGWVSSREPAGSHVGGPDIRAGTLGGTRFIGLIQFDLSPVPTDTAIYAAALELSGRETVSRGPSGQWAVRLVQSTPYEVGATPTYTDVVSAQTLAGLQPISKPEELRPGLRNYYHLQPDQLVILQDQVATGIATFVVDGSGDGDEGLFVWHSGNEPGLEALAPILRINYSTSPPPPIPTPIPVNTAYP